MINIKYFYKKRDCYPNVTFAWGLIFAVALSIAGCSQCSRSNIEKKGEAVVWESIPFGILESDFLRKATDILSLKTPPARQKVCKDQISMLYPDLAREEIRERPSGGHVLTNCTVRSLNAEQTPTLLEIKGVFIEEKLSRIVYRLSSNRYQGTLETLTKRFGEGDRMTLVEQVIIEDKSTTYQYWVDEKEIWLLAKTDADNIVLIHQDLASGRILPTPQPVSQKGKPVSLEDIGIGKLDLNAPLPSLKGLDIPDSGTTASPAPSRAKGSTEAQP